MPLLKRKPYTLSKRPRGLEANEQVFRIRITGEVFREYEDYIGRVNLYRQRVWTCKASGKTNLTYEEALLSEQRANEKIQQFPKAYIKPVLELIQFSQARLDELVDTIFKTFKDRFVEGEEVGLKKDDGAPLRVRILDVLSDGQYEVGWIKDSAPGDLEEYCERTVEGMDSLERKKYPLQKSLLKTFIRDSATIGLTKNAPLVVHEKLAKKYGITTEPPEELRELLAVRAKTKGGDKAGEKEAKLKRKLEEQDSKALAKEAKRARREEEKEQVREGKRKLKAAEEEQKRIEDELKRIKYPIEDTLVELGPTEKPPGPRPAPSNDFAVPMDLVGSLLMVWDFLMSFSKQVKLSAFALEDLEQALMYRDGEVPLLVEVHYALMRVCLDDADHYDRLSKQSKRATQVTLDTWSEDLCNYIEARDTARDDASDSDDPEAPETPNPSRGSSESFAECVSALQRGHYSDELDVRKKLALLAELVEHAVQTDIIRGQLEQNWEDLQQLRAQKREEDAEWRKAQREEKARARAEEIEQQGTTDGAVEAPVEDGTENGNGAASDEELEEGEEDGEGGEEERDGGANGVSRNGRGGSPSSSTNSALAGMSRAQERLYLLQQRAADREREEEGRRAQLEEQKRAEREKKKVAKEVTAERKKKEQEEAERQKREEFFEREFDKFFVRRKPLGLDKEHNRYWYFPRESRLFVESSDSKSWGFYQAKEELDALFTSLNTKGIRERGLQRSLERHYAKISAALSKRSRELSQKLALDEAAIRRSSRVKSAPRAAPFLAYANRYTTGYG